MSGSEDEDGPVVSLTGFLFGNVDTKTGKLEDGSIFGSDSDKQIRALENLGLGLGADLTDDDRESEDDRGTASSGAGLARESVKKTKERRPRFSYDSSDDSDSSEDSEHDADSDDFDPEIEKPNKKHKSSAKKSEEHREKDDYDDIKSETAIDFSDMNELIEEEIESKKSWETPCRPFSTTEASDDYDDDYDSVGPSEKDKKMMPPPTFLPASSTSSTATSKGGPCSTSTSSSEPVLETPLAAMLPSKYAGVPVTSIFPDFHHGKILRFSKLFGPGKYSSLPHVWKNVKKRRRKRREKQLQEEQAAHATATSSVPGLNGAGPSSSIPPPLILPPVLEEPKVLQKPDWETPWEVDPSMCVQDEEEIYCRPHEAAKEEDEEAIKRRELGRRKEDKKHLWRHGPAEIWYDMLGVPDDPENFDYGFKVKSDKEDSESEESDSSDDETKRKVAPAPVFPDDCFHMVTQLDWESNIIWDGQDPKLKKFSKNKAAGWVPSGSNRSAQNLGKQQEIIISPSLSPVKIGGSSSPFGNSPASSPSSSQGSSKSAKLAAKAMEEGGMSGAQGDDTWYSIFPVETTELVYGHWEKDIIWDVDNLDEIPEPKVLELDPNDENIILCIPEDVDPNASQNSLAPPKVKIPHPHVKKSKILLGKAGVINVIEEDSPPPSPKDDDKDPYNISLDEYYQAKHTEQALIKISTSGNIIQHSTPVVELRAPFIPTHMNLQKLRNFHRPALRKLSHGPTSVPGPHTLFPLTKHIQKKAKQREAERLAAGGGDIFFMRTPEDFSGKDGEIILTEYCEEHPPLLNQVGMCSKFKNYYKRKAGKDAGPSDSKYGETVYAHTSPFLGAMHPGQMIQTIENNMFRSPIFPHDIPKKDFLVIRTRNNFFLRSIDALFTVGQECPLYEVPGPNSKRANNFVRDFLQVFIYRLFWSSRDSPRRIRMDDIKRAFPMHSESSIRKRLKLCADFKRTGHDSNWWVIKPEFRLPTEEEIRAMVSPEQCCAYFSLIAAEQRLKDAGYGTQSILAPPPEDEDENEEKKLDDEVKVAPWNTTRAYIQAIKGKCILQINGPADPTGCGEGFSYVRMPNKPQTTVEEKETQPKRIVTGTDADLRRLSLNNAKALLRKFMVPEEEIQKLSRWEVIDVVRTLSTEKAKAGEEGMNKFSRGNRFSVAEHQERYKEECQRIFELQNRVLNSGEVLSTDEGESTEEEEDIEDIEEMGKNIEKMLSNKKTSSQLSHEKEEAERRELQRMIMGDSKDDKDEDKQPKKNKKNQEKIDEDNNNLHGLSLHPGRVLKIQRKYKTPDGKEFTRNEIVRKPHIIDIYMRIRTTKDEQFIRQFALLDDQTKEEMKKEKRRIQEQLRRIKKNQEKEHVHRPPPQRKKKVKAKPELKMKCGACGQVGHMRTNKACPFYEKNNESEPSRSVSMTEEEEGDIEKLMVDDDEELVKIDGTKMQLSGKLLKHADEIKRRSLLLKVPKDAVAGPSKIKKKRVTQVEHCDYLEGKSKSANRQRIDPQVVLTSILEAVINDLRNEHDSSHFLFPVSQKIPRYHEIITCPMDLQTIREKNREQQYQTRADFLADLKLMAENSAQYNGEHHQLTNTAERLYELAEVKLAENESKLSRLEKQINPLLDENDKKRLAYILNKIMEKVKVIPEAMCFLKPVNKKMVKNYYDVIKNPMDLETMEKLIKDGKYHSRLEFLSDMQLIHTNANSFNGPEHSVTKRALYILDFTKALMKEFDETLTILEANISKTLPDSVEDYEEGEYGMYGGGNEDSNMEPDTRTTIDSNTDEYSQYQQGEFQMSEDEDSRGPQTKRRRHDSDADDEEHEHSEYEERSRFDSRSMSSDTYNRDQQQAIEAMLNLSQSGSSMQNTYRDMSDTEQHHVDQNPNIHADLEVSDSNDEEEGEIVDEWD